MKSERERLELAVEGIKSLWFFDKNHSEIGLLNMFKSVGETKINII
jgi:hypothetical protein